MGRQQKDGRRGRQRRAKKRAYEKPRILSREKLEAMAAVCAPLTGGKSDSTCTVAFS